MSAIVITGSTRGIGFGLAWEFASRGFDIMVNGRTRQACDAAAEALSKEFPAQAIEGFACDVTDYDQVQSLWRRAKSTFGTIDIWISGAGVAHAARPLWELSADEIEQGIRINLIGEMFCAKAAISGMLEQGHGAVYNISGFGRGGELRPGISVYGTSKRAIDHLTKSLAVELEGMPVIVGQIHPHFVVTDLSRNAWLEQERGEEKLAAFERTHGDSMQNTVRIVADKILANKRNGALILRDSPFRAFIRRHLGR